MHLFSVCDLNYGIHFREAFLDMHMHYRVYKKKLNKFEIAPNVAKRLKLLSL